MVTGGDSWKGRDGDQYGAQLGDETRDQELRVEYCKLDHFVRLVSLRQLPGNKCIL
jgi:hypothetical protein